MVRGINHLTLSVPDVPAAIGFYVDVLGCKVVASWPAGAYLTAGDAWIALVAGAGESRETGDYSHIAFDVAPEEFESQRDRIVESGAPVWQDNWTEGDSLYFTDPAGHRLELHASSLAARLEAARVAPWDGLVIEPDTP